MKTPKNYVNTTVIAKRLRVNPYTVRLWVHSGKLPGIIRKDGRGYLCVFVRKDADLSKVFKVRCVWCGKIFTSRKHPGKSRYCDMNHGHMARVHGERYSRTVK